MESTYFSFSFEIRLGVLADAKAAALLKMMMMMMMMMMTVYRARKYSCYNNSMLIALE